MMTTNVTSSAPVHKTAIKVVLTGGGTGGHVIPHLALMPTMKKYHWQLFYIGSAGMEKTIIAATGIPYFQIPTGKLRRYFSWENFLDVFKVAMGTLLAVFILLRIRPKLVFSKGGFVSVPVCIAAKFLGIPVFSHESDLTPGLATKIIAKFAKKILCAFESTVQLLPASIGVYVGQPVRQDLRSGSKTRGMELCGFPQDPVKPVILVMGGSQGAQRINQALSEALGDLITRYRIIHICGAKAGLPQIHDGDYKVFPYVSDDLKHLMAATDFVISRAGANSIFEFLMLRKPMLLIPLQVGSRGDQVDNAEFFVKKGWASHLKETELNASRLTNAIADLVQQSEQIKQAQSTFNAEQVAETIVLLMSEEIRSHRRA